VKSYHSLIIDRFTPAAHYRLINTVQVNELSIFKYVIRAKWQQKIDIRDK